MRFKVLSNLLVVAMRNFPHNTSIKYTSRLCPLQDQARRVAVGRPYVRFPRFPMAISAVLSSSLGARWTGVLDTEKNSRDRQGRLEKASVVKSQKAKVFIGKP